MDSRKTAKVKPFNDMRYSKIHYQTAKRSFLITLFLGISLSFLSAQNADNKIVCLANVKKDTILVRWVPASIPVWQCGIKYGYSVERYTISRNGVFIPDGLAKATLLTPQPIRPLSQAEFETLSKANRFAAVVQEAIYGTSLQTPGNIGFNGFMKAYDELETKLGFALFMCDLSPKIAQAAGLIFVDTSVKPNERYTYSISLVNVPEGLTVPPSVVVADAGQLTKHPAIKDVRAIFLDKVVKFRWPVLFFKGAYSAYIIEKSTDGTNYKPISDLPIVTAAEKESPDYFVYSDSLKENGQLTWYRVKGITPFGEYGPASEAVKGAGVPNFSAYAVIDTAEVPDNKKVVLHWRVTEPTPKLVTGIDVSRAANPDGIYVSLTPKPLAPNVRTLTDTKPGIFNYYRITLLGSQNRKSYSFPYIVQTEDNDPPAAPQMLAGKVDSTGEVTLTWKVNEEPDLRGYRVFRANAPHEEFVLLCSGFEPANTYKDTINLNTLTHKIYYRVIAVDKRYNNSEYSDILELTRPDTICPAPAIIKHADVKEGKVTFAMEGSPSDDIQAYELWRKAETDSVAVKVAGWDINLPDTCNDSPSAQGKTFIYQLKTIDQGGNQSVYTRSVFVPGISENTILLKAEVAKKGNFIILNWNLPAGFTAAKTIIYRSTGTQPLSTYETLEGNVQTFNDKDTQLKIKYTYRIRIISDSGQVLLSNNPVEIIR